MGGFCFPDHNSRISEWITVMHVCIRGVLKIEVFMTGLILLLEFNVQHDLMSKIIPGSLSNKLFMGMSHATGPLWSALRVSEY